MDTTPLSSVTVFRLLQPEKIYAPSSVAVPGMVTSVRPPEEIKTVILDRPFVYMIVDTATNLPVFMGTVTGFSE